MNTSLSTLTASIEALGARAFLVSLADLRLQFISTELLTSLYPHGSEIGAAPVTLSSLWPSANAALTGLGLAVGDYSQVGKQFEIDTALLARGGVEINVRMRLAILSESTLLISLLSPITQLDTEAALHTQRTELLGRLASGIAHDFNNVLAGMLGHVAYLRMILPQTGSHIESLTAIEDGGKKASSMTQQILNFSKLGVIEEILPLDVRDTVSRTVNLVRAALPPSLTLNVIPFQHELCCLLNEGKLTQILVNLIMNARDACENGGEIVISLDRIADSKELSDAFGTTELPSSVYAKILVTDTGSGISQDVISRVFEPYFSTKGARGTGLGLATVAAIVRQFGGAVSIASQVRSASTSESSKSVGAQLSALFGRKDDSTIDEAGTQVAVYLPVLERRDAVKPVDTKSKELKAVRGQMEQILVIDDEPAVRNVLLLSLKHLGYEVITACSGAEAIDLFAEHSTSVDLVILDMLMPDLSGNQVFFKLQELNPDVRVLLVSGYASEESINEVLDNGGLGFLQKPFTIEDLSVNVRECLAK